jgi:hypothetical protein
MTKKKEYNKYKKHLKSNNVLSPLFNENKLNNFDKNYLDKIEDLDQSSNKSQLPLESLLHGPVHESLLHGPVHEYSKLKQNYVANNFSPLFYKNKLNNLDVMEDLDKSHIINNYSKLKQNYVLSPLFKENKLE